MNKTKIYVLLITAFFIGIISLLIFINFNYKTNEEIFSYDLQNLNYVEKNYSDDAFLMSIIYKNDVTDKGVVLEGKVIRGTVKVGDTLSLVGIDDEKEVKVEEILDYQNESVKEASEDERINIVISGISQNGIKQGQVLAQSNTIGSYYEFIAEIYILSKEEGGINKSFKKNDNLDFYIRTSSFEGKIESIKEFNKVKPGSAATIRVKLNTKIAIEEGTTFVIRSDSQTMGAGTITKVIK